MFHYEYYITLVQNLTLPNKNKLSFLFENCFG